MSDMECLRVPLGASVMGRSGIRIMTKAWKQKDLHRLSGLQYSGVV